MQNQVKRGRPRKIVVENATQKIEPKPTTCNASMLIT